MATTKKDFSARGGGAPAATRDYTDTINYKVSPEARKILDEVKLATKSSMADFVSECISEYGPTLLKSKYSKIISEPTLEARIKLIEDFYLYGRYKDLVGELDANRSRVSHKKFLKEFHKVSWHDDLSELIAAAKKNNKISKTEDYKWRLLIRHRDNFMKTKPSTTSDD